MPNPTVTEFRAANATASQNVDASLDLPNGSAWYRGGTFVLTNIGDAQKFSWRLDFDVHGGAFDNHSAWNTIETSDGVHVTLTPNENGSILPGATLRLGFGISGTGQSELKIENCAINGAPVEDCSFAGGGGVPEVPPEVVPPEEIPPSEPPAEEPPAEEPPAEEPPAEEPPAEEPPADPGAGGGLVITETSSSRTVIERYNTGFARGIELRLFAHTRMEPVSRWVNAGDVLTVTVPRRRNDLLLGIGQYGEYRDLNGGDSVGVAWRYMSGGENRIVADRSGLVWFAMHGGAPAAVTVEGGVPVPTYTKGMTSIGTFRDMFRDWTASPFVIVDTDHLLGVMRRESTTTDNWNNVNRFIDQWDRHVEFVNEFYGMRLGGAGTAKKWPQPVQMITNVSEPSWVFAWAADGVIGFPVETGAASKIFGPERDRWVFWHEVGHTYQSLWYDWPGVEEVTVDISSLAYQEARGWPSLLEWARDDIAAFKRIPVDERNFDSIRENFVKLAMFDELRQTWGPNFYADLQQHYRQLRLDGVARPRTRMAMQQMFMVETSRIAQHNLATFFRQWGLRPDEASLAVMSTFPEFTP